MSCRSAIGVLPAASKTVVWALVLGRDQLKVLVPNNKERFVPGIDLVVKKKKRRW